MCRLHGKLYGFLCGRLINAGIVEGIVLNGLSILVPLQLGRCRLPNILPHTNMVIVMSLTRLLALIDVIGVDDDCQDNAVGGRFGHKHGHLDITATAAIEGLAVIDLTLRCAVAEYADHIGTESLEGHLQLIACTAAGVERNLIGSAPTWRGAPFRLVPSCAVGIGDSCHLSIGRSLPALSLYPIRFPF